MRKFFALIIADLIFILALASLSFAGIDNLQPLGTGTIVGGDGTEYNLIYDEYQRITWLDYTSSYDDLNDQRAWAQNLQVEYNGVIFGGSGGLQWRLPATFEDMIVLNGDWDWVGLGPSGKYEYETGYNMELASEMAHLFYQSLENNGQFKTDGTSPGSYGLDTTGPFERLVESWYWSGSVYSPDPDDGWYFGFDYGEIGLRGENYLINALAVYPGKLGAESTVPVPAAAWLLGSGLLGLLGFGRKQIKRSGS